MVEIANWYEDVSGLYKQMARMARCSAPFVLIHILRNMIHLLEGGTTDICL